MVFGAGLVHSEEVDVCLDRRTVVAMEGDRGLVGQQDEHGWQPPPTGLFKVNCDATMSVVEFRWGYGVVIWNHAATFTATVSLDGRGER